MVALTGNDIDFLELCRCLIKQYESDIKGDCFLNESGFESMMIQASLDPHALSQSEINMSGDEQFALMKTLSYRSVEFSAQKLGILGMGISPKEKYMVQQADYAALSGLPDALWEQKTIEDACRLLDRYAIR